MQTKANQIFGYADVGSYGLAHSLLAWARCYLWCREKNIPMIAPTWLHLQHRIGPILRNERDKRRYHQLFQFNDYITGFRRQYLLTSKHLDENAFSLNELSDHRLAKIIVFKNKLHGNEETYFPQIVGYSKIIRKALLDMTKIAYRPIINKIPHIALHVRMGDFSKIESLDVLRSGAKLRIPLSWYCNILHGIRKSIGNVPAVVYSDGKDDELLSLLNLPNVFRSPHQTSITDLHCLSQASLIISSGSGFSAWGTYLGDSARICFPGQRFVRVLGEPENIKLDRELECEFPSELDSSFLSFIEKKLLISKIGN